MPAGGSGTRGTSGSGGPGSGRASVGGPAAGGGSGGARGGAKAKPKTQTATGGTKAGTASPSGGRTPAKRTAKKTVTPSTAPSTNAAPKGPKRGSSTAPSAGQAPAKKARPSRAGLPKGAPYGAKPGNAGATRPKAPTAKQQEKLDAYRSANPRAAASPKGRMSRADAAIQARMSSIGGRASSTFKRVPGSSQAAGMARRTGTTSVKAYNKLPGGKKTKMAIAAGIGGVPAAVGAGMYADRNKGKPSSGNSGSGKPKNGDTKTLDGRKATYRNGSWYAS